MSKKRRIQAPEPAIQPFNSQPSAAHLLLRQELGVQSSRSARARTIEGYLKELRLQRSFDVHDPVATSQMPLAYMQRRSPVLQVLTHKELLFVLVNSGLCYVYDTLVSPEKRLSFLNAGHHDIIRIIMLNPFDESVLAISCHSTDGALHSQLHCRSVPAHRRSFCCGDLYSTAGRPVLDPVEHPGFIEFDDTPQRALVFNSTSMQYKVYDLSNPNYRLLYCIPASGISEVKLSSTHLLVVRQPKHYQMQTTAGTAPAALEPSCSTVEEEGGPLEQHGVAPEAPTAVSLHNRAVEHVHEGMNAGKNSADEGSKQVLPLEVVSVVNGQCLAKHELPVPIASYFDVLELFDEYLLIKQPLQPFQIYTVLGMVLCGNSQHETLSQVSSFTYLQSQNLFMAISYHTLATWNFKAQLVAEFEDHVLWYPSNLGEPLLYLVGDWVVSYCRPKSVQTSLLAANAAGAIHVSNVRTGKLMAKVQAKQTAEQDADARELLMDSHFVAELQSDEHIVRKGLTDVTCVLYDEENNTIYSGNQAGIVHHWAPG